VIDFFFGPMRFLDSTFQKYSIQVSFISIILRILGAVFSLTGLFGIAALFTHCVKWYSCPSDGFTQRLVQKTGSFTQNTLPQVENCQVGHVDLLFHPTHTRLRGLHINNKATQQL